MARRHHGALRLALGHREYLLTAGEAAKFDTTVPHGYANACRQPLKLLVIFEPHGEQVHLRATGQKRVSSPVVR